MTLKPTLVLLLICSLCFQSCWYTGGNDDDFGPIESQYNYQPIIMQRNAFEATTTFQNSPEPILNSGKIYVKDQFIFIHEKDKGFHVINNTDPSNPQNVAFINVLGSSDLAIKGSTLYVNNATDLLALSIDAQAGTMAITKRVADAFPQLLSPQGFSYYDLQDNEVIVGWSILENN